MVIIPNVLVLPNWAAWTAICMLLLVCLAYRLIHGLLTDDYEEVKRGKGELLCGLLTIAALAGFVYLLYVNLA